MIFDDSYKFRWKLRFALIPTYITNRRQIWLRFYQDRLVGYSDDNLARIRARRLLGSKSSGYRYKVWNLKL